MPKVVITGVAGFLGSHLADKFLAEGYEVVGIDNLLGGYLENVSPGVDFYDLDLAEDWIALMSVMHGTDLVVHSACTAYEGLSVFSPSLVTRNTVQATVNILTAAVAVGAKRFVYLSSMARYGDHGGKLFDETWETRPQDPYGIAKVSAERLVENLCDIHEMEWVILVPHNIIGPRQKYDDPFRNVASIMTNRMLKGQQPIIYSDGSQQRCFSFVSDVVDPLWVACHSDDAVGEVINIGPDEEHITINELAERLADIIGFDLDPIYMPGRPQEVPIALCSSNKARRLLNYDTKTTLDEGLRELVDWIRAQGTREFDYHLPVELVTEKTPKTWTQRLF
jgi:UDP-glucose 4-epimerase